MITLVTDEMMQGKYTFFEYYKWYSVDEYLPAINRKVLVWMPSHGDWHEAVYRGNSTFQILSDEGLMDSEETTHWMLVTPPNFVTSI